MPQLLGLPPELCLKILRYLLVIHPIKNFSSGPIVGRDLIRQRSVDVYREEQLVRDRKSKHFKLHNLPLIESLHRENPKIVFYINRPDHIELHNLLLVSRRAGQLAAEAFYSGNTLCHDGYHSGSWVVGVSILYCQYVRHLVLTVHLSRGIQETHLNICLKECIALKKLHILICRGFEKWSSFEKTRADEKLVHMVEGN